LIRQRLKQIHCLRDDPIERVRRQVQLQRPRFHPGAVEQVLHDGRHPVDAAECPIDMAANGRQVRRLADSVDRLALKAVHADPQREERSPQIVGDGREHVIFRLRLRLE
jgi:hypothetical protein